MNENQPATPESKPARWLMRRARGAWRWIGLAVGLGLGGGLLVIVQAALVAHSVHAAAVDDVPRQALLPVFLLLLAVIAARAVVAWGRERAAFHASAQVRAGLRLGILEHLAALGPAYTGGERTGALASAAMEQVEALDGFFARYLPQVFLAVLIPLAILVVVFPLNWAAGTILLVTAPLVPLFMALAGMGAEWVHQRNFQALARMSAHFLDLLQGLATLRLLGRARGELEGVGRVADEYRRRTMQVLRIAFLSSAVLEFFSSVAIAVVAVYLGMSYLGYLDFGHYGRGLDLETGLFILLLAPEFYLPLRELGTHYHARAEAVGAAGEILKVLRVSGPPAVAAPRPAPSRGPIGVVFEDVHLAYAGGTRPALAGVSFTLAPGERVAIVGPSGAGKTTLLNLLLGFVRADRGRVLANGVDLASVDMEAWRARLAWLGQDPTLFHGSIRDNILLGRPGADPEAVQQAARAARVWEFARELPDGLDSHVSEGGVGLSGGQAQRVALARAFLKDAPLVLLDEPTANLDLENETLVLEAMEDLVRGRSVIMLTHRLASVRRADRILVLDAGRVVESGDHEALLERQGTYRRLVSHYRGLEHA